MKGKPNFTHLIGKFWTFRFQSNVFLLKNQWFIVFRFLEKLFDYVFIKFWVFELCLEFSQQNGFFVHLDLLIHLWKVDVDSMIW